MSAIEFWVSLRREISPSAQAEIEEAITAKMMEMLGEASSGAWIHEMRAFIGEKYKDYNPRVVTRGFDENLGSNVDSITVNVVPLPNDAEN